MSKNDTEKYPSMRQPTPIVVSDMGSAPAALKIPHLMYPDAFQAHPEEFYVAVTKEGGSLLSGFPGDRELADESEGLDG